MTWCASSRSCPTPRGRPGPARLRARLHRHLRRLRPPAQPDDGAVATRRSTAIPTRPTTRRSPRSRPWSSACQAAGRRSAPKPAAAGAARGPALQHDARAQFEDMVRRAKEYIPPATSSRSCSRSASTQARARPTRSTSTARCASLNPSPYMYYLSFGDLQHRSAPRRSVLVTEDERRGDHAPHRRHAPARRGRPRRTRALAAELLADPKERAEHIMLVDLGRNDLGRVCRYGTVRGGRADGRRALLARHAHRLATCAGELRAGQGRSSTCCARASRRARCRGAPKIRAMEIIDELEPTRRGPYGGRGRLLQLHRQHGHLHHHPHHRDATATTAYIQAAPASWPTPSRSASTRRP